MSRQCSDQRPGCKKVVSLQAETVVASWTVTSNMWVHQTPVIIDETLFEVYCILRQNMENYLVEGQPEKMIDLKVVFGKYLLKFFKAKKGPKGPTVAAKGCSPPQELEKSHP